MTTQPPPTLLLDFARQRGVIDATQHATLRGTLRDGDLAAATDTLRAAGLSAALLEEITADATVAADPPRIPGFRVLGFIGRGAAGSVWKAEQTAVGRLVALKVISVQGLADPDTILAEARTLARVQSPHVIACHDCGRHDRWCWLALQLAEGGDCERVLRKRGRPASPRSALRIGRDIAAGLEALHATGLIHRDCKPSNVLLAADGRALLGDLGLAQGARASGRGAAAGTPGFLAPEIARGTAPSVSSDVFAWGATMYALLTGAPPFTGSSPAAIIAATLADEIPDLTSRCPQLPADFAAVIRACLAKDPAARYRDAASLRADCDRLLAGEAPGHTSLAARRPVASPAQRVTRQPARLLVAALAALVVGTLLGGVLAPVGPPAAVLAARAAPTLAAWTAIRTEHPNTPWAAEAERFLAALAPSAPASAPTTDAGLTALRERHHALGERRIELQRAFEARQAATAP